MPKPLLTLAFLLIIWLVSMSIQAQPWPGAAGTLGSDAISKSDSRIKAWATGIESVKRGLVWLEMPDFGFAQTGDSTMVLGPANGQVMSLGDGGSVVLSFFPPIKNGPGFDLAVFENGFSDFFLELAQVSVSSNGVDFYPFPCFSETDTTIQVGPFDSLRAENIQGLAGKYAAGWGTPFDLEVLKNQPGLDVDHIRFVKITDVVGSVKSDGCTRDSRGRPINDPYPTPYSSGGFDLDAVAVLHQNLPVNGWVFVENQLVFHGEALHFQTSKNGHLRVLDIKGQEIQGNSISEGRHKWNQQFPKGLYLLQFQSENQTQSFKLIVL